MNPEEVYKELQEEFMQQASGKGLFGLTSQDSGKSFESLYGRIQNNRPDQEDSDSGNSGADRKDTDN